MKMYLLIISLDKDLYRFLKLMIFFPYSMTHIFLSLDYRASSSFPSWNALIPNLSVYGRCPVYLCMCVCAHAVYECVHEHLLSVCVHTCVLHTDPAVNFYLLEMGPVCGL